MRQRVLRPALGLLLVGGMLTALGCAEKPTVPEYSAGQLAVTIVAGPDVSSAVAHGSKVTFKWQASGGAGGYTYKYKIDNGSFVDLPAGESMVILSDTQVLTPGTHTFTVQVTDRSGNTATVERQFKIGSVGQFDTAPPTITITFPPEGYKLAPGKSVRFEWTVEDVSNATEAGVKAGVAAVGWAVDDTAAAATWTPSDAIPLAGVADNLSLGWHYLYVKAVDLSGNVSIAVDSVEVIEPTIMVVNEAVLEPGYSGDTPPLSPSHKFDRERFFSEILDGYSYVEWVVAEQGYPTTADIPASVKTLIWVGSGDYQNSSWGWNIGWAYTYYVAVADSIVPNVLTEFIDNGGTVWITGENWLEEINVGVEKVWPNGFENVYLGMDTSSASFGAPEVVYDFAPLNPDWPTLSTDIAKLPGGLGDFGSWTADWTPNLVPDRTEPLYRVSAYETGHGAGPPPEDNWYAAWLVKDASTGAPQVVFMGFDIYYFSVDAAKEVARNILTGIFGN